MKLVGLMPVRNEDWVLGLSARVALQWCDALVIGLHACTDRSIEIVADLFNAEPTRIISMELHGATWDEMRHRDLMLNAARSHKATHIAMIDADEVLTANLMQEDSDDDRSEFDVRGAVAGLAPGQMLELPGYNLRGSLDRFHSNGIWGDRWFSVAFKDTPEAHWAGDKFHSRNPAGVQWRNWRPIQQGEGGVMHLWGASERRLRAKHALYKVTERLRWPQKNVQEIQALYSLWTDAREPWDYKRTPREWWDYPQSTNAQMYCKHCLNVDAEPWQETEVRRLVAEHGKEKFQGLDLFGVA